MVKDLPVNLGNPREVLEKMPDIKDALAGARKELSDMIAYVELLARIVGEKPPAERAGSPSKTQGRKATRRKASAKATQTVAPSQENALRALERAGRPMGPADLYRFMEAEGMDLPASVSALNARLWAATKSGRVVKGPNSTYEPADGFPDARIPSTDDLASVRATVQDFGSNGAATQASPNGRDPAGKIQEHGGEVGSRYGTG